MKRVILGAFLMIGSGARAFPQTAVDPATALKNWINERVKQMSDRRLQDANDTSLTRERESLSGDDRSTSLVDQSSAANFFSIAANLVPVGSLNSAAGAGTTGSGAATVTAYSILAALSGKKLTDPEFYRNHRQSRQVSFTVGSTASEQEKDNTDKPGTVLGLKVAVLDGRDIYASRNQTIIQTVQAGLTKETVAFTRVSQYIQDLIFVNCGDLRECNKTTLISDPAELIKEAAKKAADFPAFLTGLEGFLRSDKIPEPLLHLIDTEITRYATATAAYLETVNHAYDAIHKGRQLAFSYQLIERPDLGNDDHSAQLIFDWGLDERLNWTVNASADYKDRKSARDSKGGRFATELQARLTHPTDSTFGRLPITLSFAAEGKWMTASKPQYAVQAKLVIPLSGGVDLPITYRWAKRRESIEGDDSSVRFGFTVDVGRVARSLASRAAGLTTGGVQ